MKCTKCNEDKSLQDFCKRKDKKRGYSYSCKSCKKEYDLKRWKVYRKTEKYRSYVQKYLKTDRYKESNKKYKQSEKGIKNRKTYIQNYSNMPKVIEHRREFYKSEKFKQWKKNKRNTDPEYKLRTLLRTRLWCALKRNYKSGSAVKDLGCSVKELKSYLEERFKEGMTWENHGKWHIDHIKPLSKFDLTNREQLLEAIHYTNLQPLWAEENLKKHNK